MRLHLFILCSCGWGRSVRETERHRCSQFAIRLNWGFLSAGQTSRCPLQCHRLSQRFRADKRSLSLANHFPDNIWRTHQLSSAIIHLLIPCLQNSIDSIKAYKWTLSKKLPREYVKAEKKIILTSSQHVYTLLAAFFHLHSPLCSNLTISHSQSSISYLFLVTFSHFSLLNSSFHNWSDTKKRHVTIAADCKCCRQIGIWRIVGRYELLLFYFFL